MGDLLILEIATDVLEHHPHVFTDGNSACLQTVFSTNPDIVIPSLPALSAPYWNNCEDGKRRRCAEVLIHPEVEPEFILRVLTRDSVRASTLAATCEKPVCCQMTLFF
jgi:hypothetical protein